MSAEPARELLTLADRPTAIFAANDLSAIADDARRPRARARRSPRTCPWSGSTTSPESALIEPPLTTIDQSIQQMGFEAVELLIALIEDPRTAPAGHAADPPRRPPVLPDRPA